MLSLFDEIVKRLAKGRAIDKRKIWASAFGASKAFNDVRFRKYSSDLFKLVKEYLIQDALADEPHLRRYLYLAALEKNQPDKLVRGVERNWEKLKQPGDAYEAGNYLFEHLLERKKYTLLNYAHRPYDRSNVEEASRALDIYYIVSKIINAVHTQSRLQTEKYQYKLKLTPLIIQFLEQDQTYLSEPLVGLHYYMYKMLVASDGHNDYYRYKAVIKLHGEELGKDKGYEFFQPALNYSRRRINEGNSDFLAEYMDIYKYALKRGYVFDDDVLDPLQFRNTILIALRHGEYEWTETYIREYQEKLPARQRINAVNYNSATLYFYQKDYNKALEFLRDVEYENTTYNLNAKTMLLAIYYETKAFDALDSLFDSINSFLTRHKELPATAVMAYGNLVSFTLRLTRMLPGDELAIRLLKADLKDKKYVASRPWLEEKVAEFMGKR